MACRKGSALIMTLMIVFMLSVLALNVCHLAGAKADITSRRMQNQRSFYLARTALRFAVEELKEDRQENEFDCVDDRWYQKFTKNGKKRKFEFYDTDNNIAGEYDIVISDESSRMNINAIEDDTLKKIFDSVSGKNNKRLIEQVREYRQSKGEEAEFVSVSELLNLEAVSPAVFFGEDYNENNSLDGWEDDGDKSLPEDNMNGRLDLGCKDLLTVFTDGKINLNCVSEAVLLNFPGINDAAAKEIISIRNGSPFRNKDDLKDLPGLSQKAKQFINRWGDVRSDVFRVIVQARSEGAKNYKQIIAVVDRSYDPVKIIYWREN